MTFRYGDCVSHDGQEAKVLGVVHGTEPALDLVTIQGEGRAETLPASSLVLIKRPALPATSVPQGDLFAEASV
jgi:hypothetical protein